MSRLLTDRTNCYVGVLASDVRKGLCIQSVAAEGLEPVDFSVRSHGLGIHMDGLFLTGLRAWPKHSFPMNSGPLSQFIFQCVRRLTDFADCEPATSAARIFMTPFFCWPARSSAGDALKVQRPLASSD